MATYVDFAYYSTTYGGKAIASTDFTALAKRASAAIDLLTMDRAAAYMAIAVPTPEEAAIIDKIKMATCAVMDEQDNFSQAGGIVASESVGSHSVTYANTTNQSLSKRLSGAAYPFLAHTGLMFRGFNADEHGTDTVYSADY